MSSCRRIASSILLASLVAGGLVSPLAHLGWMKMMDHGVHDSMDMGAMDGPETESVSGIDAPGVAECQYLALFNQSEQAAQQSAEYGNCRLAEFELEAVSDHFLLSQEANTRLARGPPVSV